MAFRSLLGAAVNVKTFCILIMLSVMEATGERIEMKGVSQFAAEFGLPYKKVLRNLNKGVTPL